MSEMTNNNRRNSVVYPTLEPTKPAMEKNQLGMICFISSEAIFFLLLILAFVYYRNDVAPVNSPDWPTAKNSLNAPLTAFFTVFLFSSSLTIWFAERAIHAGKKLTACIWLIVTVTFGSIFIIGQGIEYADLLGEKNVTISRNLFGSTFFTMTGFHGLHVFLGLVAISIIGFMILTGAIKGKNSAALNTISVYWHFVDAVWAVIFTLVYLPLLFS